jgi:hypothetical protein
MRTKKCLKGAAIGLVALGWCVGGFCLSTACLAAGPAAKPAVIDVALKDGGVLLGQVVDPQGKGLQNTNVALRHYDREVVAASTGAEGYFAIKNVRGGVYQIASGDGIGVYRLWAPGTAPPSAQEGALLVANDTVVRGQQPGSAPPGTRLKNFVSNPLVIGGVVATAIAVPVALHNSRSGSPASP